jgi:predicted anti-sigma-YlaC factor YlaD
MHELVSSHLEEYLTRPEGIPTEARAHLSECGECRAELAAMAAQARAIRALRPPDAAPEPRAGFYARVMERIELQRPVSMWAAFLDSAFGSRLALVSAALTIIMGFVLVQGEPLNGPKPMPIDPPNVAMVTDDNADRALDPAVVNNDDQDQVQNAVFASLASYRH